ncbi:hypothetical protein KZC51_01410 [Microbacterium sp. SSW1-49]|uniref:Tetratricopeptide repeat protein n=1 Tax=Microbacterium croceum TaxID=2851645 RepID=A0ABT0F9P4_9MICO|nr:hypothetical protein [Microbacterium croceum]MCK2034779.1 hypothetical protein [Microbacterium croceum]
MTGEIQLTISSALWAALPPDVREGSDPKALQIMVIASYLDLLSEDYGMSDEYDDALLERSRRPTRLLPFLRPHFFPDEAAPHDAEHLRDSLYRALSDIADIPLSTESAEALLTVAQVFWALSRDTTTRPDLPLKGGQPIDVSSASAGAIRQQAWIGLDGHEVDFARLKRSVRANRAKGVAATSGRGLLLRGGEITAAVARQMVQQTPASASEVGPVSLRLREENGVSTREIVWHDHGAAPRPQSGGAREPLRAMSRVADGLRESVDRLKFLSEALPIEHEAALSAAALTAGFAFVEAGRFADAREHFSTTAKITEMLSVLYPHEDAHEVRLVTALLMSALMTLASGSPDTTDLLARAASLSQSLADRDDDHVDLVTVSLTLQGMLLLQCGDATSARSAMTRAVRISTRIMRRDQQDAGSRLLLSNSLFGLATVDLSEGRAHDALAGATQSAELAATLSAGSSDELAARTLQIGALQMSSGALDVLGRTPEALDVMTDAVTLAQDLVRDEPADQRVRHLLALSLYLQGTLRLSLDRDVEAIESMSSAVTQFERLSSEMGIGQAAHLVAGPDEMHVTALFVQGALLADLGEHRRAESALLRAVGLLDGAVDRERRDRLVLALEALGEMYREQGRDADAAYAEYRAAHARGDVGPL